jgi:hypothetical protein
MQGLSLSGNDPAVQLELHYQGNPANGAAWFGGVWASTVRLGRVSESTVELEAFLGRQWAMGTDWQGKLTVAHYEHPWSDLPNQYDYDELTAEVSYRDTLKLTAAYSPNTDLYSTYYGLAEDRKSLTYEASAGVPILKSLTASAGLGYRDLTSLFDTGYWYGSVGLSYDRARLHASLFRVQTDHTAQHLFYGDMASSAWVGTVLWTF